MRKKKEPNSKTRDSTSFSFGAEEEEEATQAYSADQKKKGSGGKFEGPIAAARRKKEEEKRIKELEKQRQAEIRRKEQAKSAKLWFWLMTGIVAAIFVVAIVTNINMHPDDDEAESTEQTAEVVEKPVEQETTDVSGESNAIETRSPEKTENIENQEQEETPSVTNETTSQDNQEGILIGNFGDGQIEWLSLTDDGSKTLLITKYIIAQKPYNETIMAQETGWQKSSIRAWLNGEFLQNAFSDSERAAVIDTTVHDVYYREPEESTDKIFLLNQEQVDTYFVDPNIRYLHTTNTDYAAGMTKYPEDAWWLVDSTDRGPLFKVLIGSNGGRRVNETSGVRPAMWVSDDFLKSLSN